MENRRQPFRPIDEPIRQRRLAGLSFVQPVVTATIVKSSRVKSTQSILSPHPTTPVASQWLQGKNLDFCLLAVCSCVLAVLCHQTVHLPASQSAPASTLAASSRVLPSQLDFMLKAGLFTSSNQRSEGDEEIAE